MRWKARPQPKIGDVRTIQKFLLLPRCLGREWRWLEVARIHQQRISYMNEFFNMKMAWKNIGWAN